MIRVLKPGLLTAVQDAGRRGYQRFGVSVGGASDPFPLRVANALVGNDAYAAGLEMTLTGPQLQFDRETLVAWCGADFDATLDEQPLPKNRPVRVPAGGIVHFAAAKHGTTAWLAVGGGIAVLDVMGSRSTDLIVKIGGVGGRRLAAADVLPAGLASAWAQAMLEFLRRTGPATWSLPPERLGEPAEPYTLRAVRGPEWDWFTADAQGIFFRETFRVTKESNRMGTRLVGHSLPLTERREMASAAVHHGVVQVPPSGQPIVLGADRQTIGGYPRIGVVATVDFGRLAQLRPGDAVRFREVTIVQAHDVLLQRERDFAVARAELARRVDS
jgi:antagonist of KipI